MVIFASLRPLERAENIKAVWDAYDGEKIFARSNTKAGKEIIKNVEADCVVTDEYISQSASPIIMIFHGIAGGKTYGLDQSKPYHYKENVENYLYFITSSEQMVDFVAKQCGAPKEKILPLVLYEKDFEVYSKERGMYFDYPEGYSGRHVRTEEDLIDTLRRSQVTDYICRGNRDYLAGSCDGHAAERLIKLINDIS